MGLTADGAKAHRAGRETFDDLARRFDLVEAQRRFSELEPHQAADGQKALGLFVNAGGKGLVLMGQVATNSVL